MDEDKLICESCEKECEELHKSEYYIMTYAVDWICIKCVENVGDKDARNISKASM